MKTKKGDFVELLYTGKTQDRIFDSNIPEYLKALDPKAEPQKTIVVIGEQMVIPGLDKVLEDKEIGQEYKVNVPYKEGFGPRKRELVKTIPLSVFREKNINPRPGEAFYLDNQIVKVITVSGARVITDFNNPLAGKDLEYKFTITRIVQDKKEQAESFFQNFFRTIPKFEISNDKVMVEAPKPAEKLIDLYKEKFKEMIGLDLDFKELKENRESK